MARATSSAAALDLTTIRKLYDSWIDCAEQAYAATVHTEDFCRAQAELINVATSLLLEQRRQVESLAPMFGVVTCSEVDGLYVSRTAQGHVPGLIASWIRARA
jgi:polyhydroxyalkanoate synthase subunit PhaE